MILAWIAIWAGRMSSPVTKSRTLGTVERGPVMISELLPVSATTRERDPIGITLLTVSTSSPALA